MRRRVALLATLLLPARAIAQVDQLSTPPPNLVPSNYNSVPVGPYGGLEGSALFAGLSVPGTGDAQMLYAAAERRAAIRKLTYFFSAALLAGVVTAPLVVVAQDGSAKKQSTAASPNPSTPWKGDLDGMIKRRMIRVLVPYSKTHYFIDKGVQRGVTYDALKQFEDDLNTKLKTGNLRVHVVFLPTSRDRLQQALLDGRGDIVAANITVTPGREELADFATPTYSNVKEIVVTGPGAPAVTSVDDLAGKTVQVRQISTYRESLDALNATLKQQGKPAIDIKFLPDSLEDEDILEMVNAGLVKITVVDDHIASFWKQIFTAIDVHADVAVKTGGQVAMAVRKDDPKLKAELDAFVARRGKGTVFGNVTLRKYLQSAKYVKQATSPEEIAKFNRIVELFRKYGDQYDVDWLLMAAQGYQESGLDQTVHSKVGAIGVMQVMPATGKDMNVGDITQIAPNINARVKYMRFMIDRYFKDEPMDRLNKGLFAFASYNAGPARVRQLRAEAKRTGLDPNVWFNNVERVAAARIGRETVQYVSNIYKYYVAYQLAYAETHPPTGRVPSPTSGR